MKKFNTGKIKFGDVICVKSFSFLGWAIGNSFHVKSPMDWKLGSKAQKKRPSNHNGIIGLDNDGKYCIFESLGSGVTITPLNQYFDEIGQRKCEIKVVRLKGLILDLKAIEYGQSWLNRQVGVKYDFLSFASHIWRNTLNLPNIKAIHSDNRFYCTELVMKFYQFIQPWANIRPTDFFNKKLPTPYTVEKRWNEGKLIIVDEWF